MMDAVDAGDVVVGDLEVALLLLVVVSAVVLSSTVVVAVALAVVADATDLAANKALTLVSISSADKQPNTSPETNTRMH